MRNLVLKVLCLAAVAGCEAGAPASPSAAPTAREEIEAAAVRAGTTLADGAGAAEVPACRAGERPIYACDFGDRRLAVCATDDRIAYRYGDAHKTDLEIVSREGAVRAYQGGVVGGGGGQQTHLRFTNNGWDYIVHSAAAGSLTETPGLRWSGVVVMRNGQVRQERACPQTGDAQVISSAALEQSPAVTAETDPDFEAWY